MNSPRIGIVSFRDDLHALLVQKELTEARGAACDIFEINSISAGDALNCWITNESTRCSLSNSAGEACYPGDYDLIWLRRTNLPQLQTEFMGDKQHVEITNVDSPTALLGGLFVNFDGVWVNHPRSIHHANNKLFQLHCAQEVGLRIPETLISQDPDTIRQFSDEHGGKVVIKPVKGRPSVPNKTQVVDPREAPDAVLNSCPTIYQEYIGGTTHLRAHVFGDDVHAATLDSPDVDWRFDLTVPFSDSSVSDDIADKLRKVVSRMDLRMGVCDLKRLPSGEHVFLECNQQGQFLFIEALTGQDLVSPFVDFLLREASRLPGS